MNECPLCSVPLFADRARHMAAHEKERFASPPPKEFTEMFKRQKEKEPVK